MKPPAELPRTTPLVRRTPFPRTGLSRNASPPQKATKSTRRSTGPTQRVRKLVAARSDGVCEWPFCVGEATDLHHRLNRKAGGRQGEMAERLNLPAWLIHACRDHHAVVTSPVGEARLQAIAMGWLLLEGQNAERVSAMTCHGRVWLTNDGGLATVAPAVAS